VSPGPHRTGVAVIRIWLDDDSGQLRARVTETLDIADRVERMRAAASTDDVLRIVRDWIEEFVVSAGG
jgi:hypothetical protein